MRQLLLGGNKAYTSAATDITTIDAGALGIYYFNADIATLTTTGEEIKDKALIVLGRTAANGGPIVLPFNKYHFSVVKSAFIASTKYKGTITIKAQTRRGTSSVIITKKGVKFNERSNFTADTYITDTTTTAAAIAAKLVTSINNNSRASGVTASAVGAVITVDAVTAGDNYSLLGADEQFGAVVTTTTAGLPGQNDAAYVADLASKAAADAGFEYTYQEDVSYLYPNYPLNPLVQPNSADVGFTVYTLRCAEPREVKTRDEVVHQIIQVVVPTGAAVIASLDTIFNTIVNGPAPEDPEV